MVEVQHQDTRYSSGALTLSDQQLFPNVHHLLQLGCVLLCVCVCVWVVLVVLCVWVALYLYLWVC